MILAIITTITSTLGIIGFFCDIPALIVIGGMMYVIETIIGLITGELRSLCTTILSSIVSILVSVFNEYNIFLGWCFGLCVETIILSVASIIFMAVVAFAKNKEATTNESTNIPENSKEFDTANTTIDREWVENILNGGSLEPVDVSDVLSEEVLNEIIDEQASLFGFLESEASE